MDRLAKVDGDALVRRLRDDFERTVREVAEAVNAAPDGHLIDGSENKAGQVRENKAGQVRLPG